MNSGEQPAVPRRASSRKPGCCYCTACWCSFAFTYAGMASVPSFVPQIAQLTDVLHSFFQVVAHHGLLTIYGLNRRLLPRMQAIAHKAFTLNHPSTELAEAPQQPHPSAFPSLRQARKATTRATGMPSGIESASCHMDLWRPPRKFVLHLFRVPRQQPRIYTWTPSHFICTSEAEGSCILAVEDDSQITLLNN